MSLTAIIYARVSSARQAEDGLPVESQLDQCHAKAVSLGASVLEVFRDDGISGRSTTKRPGFESAIEFCDRNTVNLFICWSTSRFARNRLDAAMHKRLLEKLGTRLVYVSQEFGEGDDGWLAEAITEVIDESYSRQVSKDTRRSMVKNAHDGFWNGGHVPFGYQAVAIGKRRRLEPSPTEAVTVRLMFRWCNAGAGGKDIAVRLNEAGTSRRGRRWDKASVLSVLKSRVMIGEIAYNDRGTPIVTPAAHAAIITMEEFVRTQDTLGSRAPRNVGGRPRSDAIFVGMLRCGECGEAMMTETATGRSQRYHYYNCRSFLKGMGCHSHRSPVDKLDDWLLDGILDRVFCVENMRGIAADLKASGSAWLRDHEAKIASSERELQSVDARLRKLYDAIEAGAGLALSDVAPRIRELRTLQETTRRQLDQLLVQPAPPSAITDHEVLQAASFFRDIVTDCEDPRRIRGFLSGIVRRIVLEGDMARVEYWPERIVKAANGGSQCDERWLPDLSTMRTIHLAAPTWLRKSA